MFHFFCLIEVMTKALDFHLRKELIIRIMCQKYLKVINA